MKSKRIRFGPGDTLGGTAPLIMMGRIDAYERRRRVRRGRTLGWVMLFAAAAILAMVLVDAVLRGVQLPFLT